jgi:hypothetical protein
MLKIRETPCTLGKFSNNLDKHGEDDLTSFDVPITLELKRATLNALVDDRLFDKRVFDEPAKGKPTPVGEGFLKFGPLKFRDTFEDARIELTFDRTTLSYEKCKVSKIVLEFCLGGTTECSMSLHIKPATDKEILLLLHHQRRDVLISISGGKLVSAKAQQDLELAKAEDEDGEPAGNAKDPRPIGGNPDDNVRPIR